MPARWRTSDSGLKTHLPPLSLTYTSIRMHRSAAAGCEFGRRYHQCPCHAPISALSIKNPRHMRDEWSLRTSIPQSWPISRGSHREYQPPAEMEAPRPELHLSAQDSIPELTLKARESEAAQLGETLLRIGDGQLFIDHFELKGKGTALRATARQLARKCTLNLRLPVPSDAQLLNLPEQQPVFRDCRPRTRGRRNRPGTSVSGNVTWKTGDLSHDPSACRRKSAGTQNSPARGNVERV